MEKFYRARIGKTKFPETKSATAEGAWTKLESIKRMPRAELRQMGYRVKLVIDAEESDIATAADVAEVVAPKPVGKIIGILKGLFGK